MHVPRVCAPEAASADRVQLSEEDSQHLVRVLRMRPGDPVLVFDGRGAQWAARLLVAHPRAATLERGVPVPAAAEPAVAVTLASALLKGDQMDDVVRDATMMGVVAIVPIVTDHVVVPERAWQRGSPVERWRRVALASAKQCGRAAVPDVRAVLAFDDLWEHARLEVTIICAEPSIAGARVADAGARPLSALVCVGPEGGWTDRELALAEQHGARRLSLGPRTLRASAAPTVALASLWTTWGW